MSSPESDSKVVAEDEDEEQIYQMIYDMNTTDDKQGNEKVQIPSSSGLTPVHLKINAERRTHAVVGNTKGLDMDALDNIQRIPVLKVNAGEKPWRKAGADISDYFNYGFDEESWNTYSKKQSKFRATNRKLYTKIMVQKGHTRHEEKESCSAYPSGSPSILASRQSSATIDVIGGRPGSSGRVEGRQCLSVKENNTQVITAMSPKEDRITPYHLPPPSNVNSLFAFIPPPPLLYRPGPPPLSPIATLDSGHSKGFDDPSTSLYPCSSAVSSIIPRSMTSSAGVIDTAKAWECFIRQEKCDKDRERSERDSKRGRDKDGESCSSSYNSGEERIRHRDANGTRRGDKGEGWQKPSCSSSSRSSKDGGEDRDSQGRHKHKKAKRNRKDKETNKMSSADKERKLKSD